MHQKRIFAGSRGIFRQAALLAACLASVAQATTYTITSNDMGLSSNNGICGFREAIDAINSGTAKWGCAAPTSSNTINLSPATYTAPVGLALTRSMSIRCPTGTCIVDAGTIRADLFTLSGANNPSVSMYRLTLRKTAGVNNPSGVVVFSGTVNLEGSSLTGFYSGLSVRAGTGHNVQVCTFSNNRYGLSLQDGVTLASRFNTVSGNWQGIQFGIGSFNDVGSVISNSTDAGISYTGMGGSMYLESTTITGNRNRGIQMGISSFLTLNKCTIDGNMTSGDGGGIHIPAKLNDNGKTAHAEIFDCTFSNNSASGNGGGLYLSGAANLTNVTVSNNFAARGGGAYTITYNSTSYLKFIQSTVAYNRATVSGGGITSVFLHGDQVVGVNSSIVAWNTAPSHPDISGPNIGTESLYRILDGSTGDHSDDLIPDDPLLGPLMDNAGPIRIKTHALLKGSPAKDRVLTVRDPRTDARGLPRPSTPSWDVGAYEDGPFETELLTVLSSQGWHAQQTGSDLSNGAATIIRSGAVGNFVTYAVAVPEAVTAGTPYIIQVQARKSPDGAIVELATSRDGNQFTTIGQMDLYSPSSQLAVFTMNTFNFTSTGIKHFRLKITGKHPSSLGYFCLFDYIKITRQ